MMLTTRPTGDYALLLTNADRREYNRFMARSYTLAVWQPTRIKSRMLGLGRQRTLVRGKVRPDQLEALAEALAFAVSK